MDNVVPTTQSLNLKIKATQRLLKLSLSDKMLSERICFTFDDNF